MSFQDAIKICFVKYFDLKGTASRSEYWWFFLFVVLVSTALSFVGDIATAIFSLAMLAPSIAVATRRLHDTNRSGWWQLISLVPVIGIILLIVFLAQKSKSAIVPVGDETVA
jgi:uncharacterized membrane protein YhaH (DUF805 family)